MAPPVAASDRWTRYNATVLTICILGWAFDIYEATIMQLVTPILIKEWGITPATMGMVTTVSRWIGLIGTFAFPVFADLYGRKPALIWAILGYSVFTGLTGFSTGWISLLDLQLDHAHCARRREPGRHADGHRDRADQMARHRAWAASSAAIRSATCCARLAALVVVPLWGWRSLYFLGIIPALLVLWIRIGIKESPRYERVTAQMLKEGLKKQLDILSPARQYPREMLIASLVYFFYLFTWLGWSAWMPFYLATEKQLGFQTMGSYLTIWMACAIFAYWFCGWLCDLFGRRWVIPAFAVPARHSAGRDGLPRRPHQPVLGRAWPTNFLITGSFGTGLGYTAELFPTQIRGTGVGASFTFGLAAASLAPMIMGWIATAHSVAAGLPLLALSFLLLAPLFIWFAPDMTRKELTDFVGQRVG